MVDINEIYKSNSDYLKAEDIGTDMPVFTIQTADVKHFDNGDSKLVLQFHETDKSLPLNVTNARAVAEMHGNNSSDWLGRQIMLFTMPVDFQGRMVQAIRIRAPATQAQSFQAQSFQVPLEDPPPAPPATGPNDYGAQSGR